MEDHARGPAPIDYPWDHPPGPVEAIEVAEGILWMRLPLPMALDHVNVYALADADGWTIVDTGMGTGKTRRMWQDLLTGPLAGKPVKRLLVTHHHPDHIGLAGWFQTEHCVELITTRTAWLFARMLRLDEQDVPPPETLRFWERAGMAPDILDQRRAERPFNYADGVAPMPLGFRGVRDGQTIQLGQRDWTVRLGQGHAPDQITLWCQSEPLVIGGDQLIPSISPNIGVYATEPDANPLDAWLMSCRAFRTHAQDDQLVLPGHKLPFTGLPMRLRQLIDNHHGALDRLREFLQAPRAAGECFPPLFKREIKAAEYGLALVEAIAHINYLRFTGEIEGSLRADGAMAWQIQKN